MAAISCILLVDDDDTTNFLSQMLLKRMAIADTILVAGNGQEALDLLQARCVPAVTSTCPTLILLDMKMPRMNGFEFLQAYAQRPPAENPAVVIIMLTTSLNPRDVDHLHDLPVSGYLAKPLTRDKIDQLLLEHFPATRARP